MKKKEKQVIILVGVILLVALIIAGIIFFAIGVSKQKQARIEGYEKCKEDLESEWQQARTMIQKTQDKEIELNDSLNALGLCNSDLISCGVNLSECQKIVTQPDVYYLFGETFEFNYEEITVIILSILLIIPISFVLTLFKVVLRIKIDGLAFFLAAVCILMLALMIMVIVMGVE